MSIEDIKIQIKAMVAEQGQVDLKVITDDTYMTDIAGDSYATWYCFSVLKEKFGLVFDKDTNVKMLTFAQIWERLAARTASCTMSKSML